jgi:GWxTD domain-containing protein
MAVKKKNSHSYRKHQNPYYKQNADSMEQFISASRMLAVRYKLLYLLLFCSVTASLLNAQQIFVERIGERNLLSIVVSSDELLHNKNIEHEMTIQAILSRNNKLIHRHIDLIRVYPLKHDHQNFLYQYFNEAEPGMYDLTIRLNNRTLGSKMEEKFSINIPKEKAFTSNAYLTYLNNKNIFIPSNSKWQNYAESLMLYFYTDSKPEQVTLVLQNKQKISIPPSDYIAFPLPDSMLHKNFNNAYIECIFKNKQVNKRFELYSAKKIIFSKYDLDDQLLQLRYILTQNEYEYMRKVPKKSLEDAIKQYWESKDPTPDTPENEYQELVYSRIIEADNRYSIRGFKPGWKTDFGMIYIKYGDPDEIQKENFPVGKYPVVIWTYRSLDRVFYFDDKKGFGYYELRNHTDF